MCIEIRGPDVIYVMPQEPWNAWLSTKMYSVEQTISINPEETGGKFI
jgi:hypothetical protein